MLDLVAVLILGIRPLQAAWHTKVIEAIDRHRSIGFKDDAVVVSSLATHIEEDLERQSWDLT